MPPPLDFRAIHLRYGVHHSFAFLAQKGSSAYRSVDDDLGTFRDLLERLHEVIVSEEEVEFGDLLLYEVPDGLEAWRALLTDTAGALENHEEKGHIASN